MKYLWLLLLLLPWNLHAQTSGQVDLLWEAETYTPPFYRGHSLASAEANITVVAEARFYSGQGNLIPDQKLDFQWTKDNRQISSASGLGGNILRFTSGPSGLAHHLEVLVKSPDGQNASAKLLIPINSPQPLLYEDKPPTGTNYRQAINGILDLPQAEISLRAEPYGFNTKALKNKRLQYSWWLNNKPTITNSAEPQLITLAAPEGEGAGENELQLQIRNLDQILQEALLKLTIKFSPANFNF